tara:strand:- start:181 stop:561 length:381 start_codon:yes stop_codon:yes gene_type:complete
MRSVYEFKKGDEVVRVTPSKPIVTLNDEIRDRSYIGQKMIFVGIANGQVYLERADEFSKKVFKDELVDLPLDIFDEGWDYYVDPKKLYDAIIPIKSLKLALESAIKREDYEMAEKLRKEITKRKNK